MTRFLLAAIIGLFVLAPSAYAHEELHDFRSSETAVSFTGHNHRDVIHGSDFPDRLQGARGPDFVQGHRGDDSLFGGRGADELRGGPGNDWISPGRGINIVYCGEGDDTLNIGEGTVEHQGCETVVEPDPPPPPPGDEVNCLVSNRDQWELAGTNCAYNTLLEFTNEQFQCTGPLSAFGELPLKLVWNFTGNPNFGDQGHLMMGANCHGDGNSDTIDVIVQSNANGTTLGACGGAGKFQQAPGPHDIQITGNFDGGPVCGGAHQDVWQFHPQNNPARIDIVNGTSGDWDAGTATVVGAGGAIFFSDVYDIDVYGGRYVTCNHGYFGNSSSFNEVVDAGFRTGRTDGSDPKCAPYSASDPCILRASSPAQVTNVIAERWLGGQWTSRPCRT